MTGTLEPSPYGSWATPIGALQVSQDSPRLFDLRVSGGDMYYSVDRPTDPTRTQVVRVRRGASFDEELLAEPYSARSFVHEYGGGAWWLAGDALIFSNAEDERLWRADPDFDPIALTPRPDIGERLRYTNGVMTPDDRWIICVHEHHGANGDEPVNSLVTIDATGGPAIDLRSVSDFVSSPQLDPSGEWLAWLEWNHPDMPWDSTELWVSRIDRAGGLPFLADATCVHRQVGTALSQPEWDAQGHLWVISDESGWGNLYRFAEPQMPTEAPEPVITGEFEIAQPHWQFGESRYGFLADGRVAFAFSIDGVDQLGCYDPALNSTVDVSTGYRSIRQLRTSGSAAYFIGASDAAPEAIVKVSIGEGGRAKTTEPVGTHEMSELGEFSRGQSITFPTSGGERSFGIYYPPTSSRFRGVEGTKPPLIVAIHGGPTAAASPQFNLRTQFWTSRGFAYVDVNYRGSTGFGRPYRDALAGRWGVADVEDCVAAATYLSEAGFVDPDRLIIRGSSAGGFTALAALCSTDIFAAGASLYGVAELEGLARDTHKFESRYLDGLIAPYPEGRDIYVERSPLSQIDRLSSPLIVFQGLLDKVVPPAQAHMIVDALKDREIPYSYVEFPDEGHGFKRSKNAIAALESELSFYSQVLGFDHPPDVTPVEVHNHR